MQHEKTRAEGSVFPSDYILETRHLRKTFYKNGHPVTAVDDVCFSMPAGSCLGLVGESGSGKTTVAGLITGQIQADSGSVFLSGKKIAGGDLRGRKKWNPDIQEIFQSPQESFDPRRRLGHGIAEGLCNKGLRKKEAGKRTQELLGLVGLDPSLARRYPFEVSGGQCQRAAIARALALHPRLLICDEATSALDATVQKQIMDLLKNIQEDTGLSILLICHDLALVQEICDHVLVMHRGKIIESGETEKVLFYPEKEYTQNLIRCSF